MLEKRQAIPASEDSLHVPGYCPDKGFFLEYQQVPFEITEKFNINNAWWLAEFSRLAYSQDPNLILSESAKVGFTVKVFDKKDSGGFVAHNDSIVVVSFRGTELYTGIGDILLDLDFIMTKFELGGQVHTGFKSSINMIWDDMKIYIEPLLETRKLFYTGHSLGAAMSLIGAARLPGVAIYNFGCPRTGNAEFAEKITTPFYRIAKHLDIVTKVPPPLFYKHAGYLILINEHGEVNENPTVFQEWKITDRDEWTVFKGIFKHMITRGKTDILDKYIHDHNIYNYSVYMWNRVVDDQTNLDKIQ
jgi:triacylglycerol lipase